MEKLKRDYGNVLWAGKKCILGMPISFTRYILTDTTLYTKIGFFNIREDEVELYRIFDKKISFTLGQRIFGCGTIDLVSKDIDTPEKKLISIKKPREVKKILDAVVKEQRDKYYVRGRDMIGGAIDSQDELMQDHFTEI
jgi:hypothetical protein